MNDHEIEDAMNNLQLEWTRREHRARRRGKKSAVSGGKSA